MTMVLDSLLPVLLGYGMGSLPIGYLLTSRLRGIDLRRVGSGNIGATNVYRSTGLAMALLVMAVDVAKGAGTVLLAARVAGSGAIPVAAGVAAIVGHVYPVWLQFRGGKGVATAAGVFSVLAPLATLVAASAFVITVWMTRYVSLGSIVATAALPPLAWAADAPAAVVLGGVIAAVLIIGRHRGNLGRLQAGTERRLGH
jgi:glycerol-3-phosphate acyltransferase PlsY